MNLASGLRSRCCSQAVPQCAHAAGMVGAPIAGSGGLMAANGTATLQPHVAHSKTTAAKSVRSKRSRCSVVMGEGGWPRLSLVRRTGQFSSFSRGGPRASATASPVCQHPFRHGRAVPRQHRRRRHRTDDGDALGRFGSDHDAFDFVDGHGVRRPVVELRRLRRRVPGDLLGVLQGPSVR